MMAMTFDHATTVILVLAVLLHSTMATTTNRQREVWGWASFSMDLDAITKQLLEYPSLFDGIQIICGATFHDDGIKFNETTWNECRPIIDTCIRTKTKFQLWIVGPVPSNAYQNPQPFIDDAVAIRDRVVVASAAAAEEFSRPNNSSASQSSSLLFDGFSLDDERDCAPRATLQEFEEWMIFHNAFGQGLNEHQMSLTSAVQALFAIEDVPNNLPCQNAPSSYKYNPTMKGLLHNATLTKWLVMDTYYFSTGRFMGALDWHRSNIPVPQLAIGMMNRDDLSIDDITARFYAIDKAGVDWINMWHYPVDEIFIPFLKRWKSNCQGCGVQHVLGCYDMDIVCDTQDEQPSTTIIG